MAQKQVLRTSGDSRMHEGILAWPDPIPHGGKHFPLCRMWSGQWAHQNGWVVGREQIPLYEYISKGRGDQYHNELYM